MLRRFGRPALAPPRPVAGGSRGGDGGAEALVPVVIPAPGDRTRRARPVVALLASSALLAIGGELSGQEPRVHPGERVRVLSPTLSPTAMVGEVVTADGSGFMLRTETGSEHSMTMLQVDSLWIWDGTRGSSQRGGLIGAGVGFLGGFTYGMQKDCSWLFEDDCGGVRVASAALWGIVMSGAGALVGAGLGELFRRDQWLEVPESSRDVVHVRAKLGRGGRFDAIASVTFGCCR